MFVLLAIKQLFTTLINPRPSQGPQSQQDYKKQQARNLKQSQ
jgi:hypothetical protein